MQMPVLQTERVLVRPFTIDDLSAVHDLLDVQLADADMGTDGAYTLAERERWLRWTVLNYDQLTHLHQPPYGDRAIVLRETGELIGACGLVPCLGPFEQLPSYGGLGPGQPLSPAVGLYYALSPRWQGQGFATEAARALVEYCHRELQLRRVIATTAYINETSQRVMARLGMRVERNPYPDPPWFQVVGTSDNLNI
jgi:[ribosomal protein S5]-alanine N-acetyltransferase